MKKILVLLLLISSIVSAQDSTYIQYSTGNVEAFKPVKLVDAFDKAFGYDKDVKFRVKAGISDYGIKNTTLMRKGLSFSLEYQIGKKFSAKANIVEKPSSSFDGSRKWRYGIEFRKYFNKSSHLNTLSGKYIGLGLLWHDANLEELKPATGYINYTLSPYRTGKKDIHLKLGQQFGGSLDFGLDLGFKQIQETKISSEGIFGFNSNEKWQSYIQSVSVFSFGLDFPLKKVPKETCDFLNCNVPFRNLLKLNLSDLFYLDSYKRNFNISVSYEQKLGSLPISIDGELNINHLAMKVDGTNGVKSIPFEGQLLNIMNYTGNKFWSKRNVTNTKLELRYYPFQIKQIASGKASEGLSGTYLGPFINKNFFLNGTKEIKIEGIGFYNLRNGITYGGVIGHQKKVMKNYYYDASIEFGHLGLFGYTIRNNFHFNPHFKFGFAF